MGHLLLVSPTRITKFFVASDITTFLVQATGGGLSTADDVNTALTGGHIFLAGLALQLASYAFFSCVYLLFLWRVWKGEKDVWTRARRIGNDGVPIDESEYKWWRDWRALAGALFISCIGILVSFILFLSLSHSLAHAPLVATNARYHSRISYQGDPTDLIFSAFCAIIV